MSRPIKPVPLDQDPSGWIANGPKSVDLLLDARVGVVIIPTDRLPVAEFRDEREAQDASYGAHRPCQAAR